MSKQNGAPLTPITAESVSSQSAPYAVVTGDVIGFTRLSSSSQNRVLEEIEAAGVELSSLRLGLPLTPVDVFRGDGWQLVLGRPGGALEVVLLLRARVLSLPLPDGVADTRAAIGIGPVSRIDRTRAARGLGVAFELSGRSLDDLEGDRRMAVSILEEDRTIPAAGLQTVLALLDAIVRRWTRRQATAVAGALTGHTQREIGQRWPGGSISQQAIAQHLEGAAWKEVEEAIRFFRSCWTDPVKE